MTVFRGSFPQVFEKQTCPQAYQVVSKPDQELLWPDASVQFDEPPEGFPLRRSASDGQLVFDSMDIVSSAHQDQSVCAVTKVSKNVHRKAKGAPRAVDTK